MNIDKNIKMKVGHFARIKELEYGHAYNAGFFQVLVERMLSELPKERQVEYLDELSRCCGEAL